MGSPELISRHRDTGGSHILTTPEAIVRQHRIKSMERKLESLRREKKPSSTLERILKVFLWLAIGWGIGYFHHFLAASP